MHSTFASEPFVGVDVKLGRAFFLVEYAQPSAEYAFEAGSWEISPELVVDFVDGEDVWVLGLVFGKGF